MSDENVSNLIAGITIVAILFISYLVARRR